MNVIVLNKSTLVTDAQAAQMAKIVDFQVKYHFAPAWRQWATGVTFLPATTKLPWDACPIAIFDDSDTPGAAGWHSENAGQPFGRVFAKPCLNVGGDLFSRDPSVCAILSHEVLELLGDPPVNRWVDDLRGTEYPLEMCDWVEGDFYTVNISGVGPGRVSNFLLPAAFDPTGVPGPFDYLRLLKAPFTIRPNGYSVYRAANGTVQTKFGAEYPTWRKATKSVPAARTYRRLVTP